MTSDLLESLKTRVNKRAMPKAAFLEHKNDITTALNAGYSIKEIWNILSESECILCSYPWFSKLVKRYILNTFTSKSVIADNPGHTGIDAERVSIDSGGKDENTSPLNVDSVIPDNHRDAVEYSLIRSHTSYHKFDNTPATPESIFGKSVRRNTRNI